MDVLGAAAVDLGQRNPVQVDILRLDRAAGAAFPYQLAVLVVVIDRDRSTNGFLHPLAVGVVDVVPGLGGSRLDQPLVLVVGVDLRVFRDRVAPLASEVKLAGFGPVMPESRLLPCA